MQDEFQELGRAAGRAQPLNSLQMLQARKGSRLSKLSDERTRLGWCNSRHKETLDLKTCRHVSSFVVCCARQPFRCSICSLRPMH